jgi:hypothetical protein
MLDIIIGVFLAYYWTGLDMVLFHSKQSPIDQPGYVHKGFSPKLIAGLFWPYTTKINQEFLWYSVCFLSCLIVFTFAHSFLVPFVGSTGLTVLIIGIVRVVPVISAIVSIPLSILAMILWIFIGKPFGGQMPRGIN